MSDTATNPIRDAIQEAITENSVILFMKGTPDAPACGFSARTVAISNWPTIPQLFVGGALVGGCDIVTEMYESGELHQTLGLEAPDDTQVPAGAPVQSAPMSIENRL
jgi:monothiol glutaredoxin